MLEFAEKVTLNPSGIKEKDVHDLRGKGLTEEQIFDTAMVAAFFNFMDRVADAFGVELDREVGERAAAAP